jgi:hypothetical protein
VQQTETAPYEPRRPGLIAFIAYLIPVAVMFWPLLQGKFLGGTSSDQYVAGFSFRDFGAEIFRSTGSIPQWNPYLFGGMPYMGAMHGDIFYPTAWLRWIMPVGLAMGLGFAIHILLAGLFTYLFMRVLRFSWTAALAGGLAYELSGIVLSMVHPGHDGKLFVSALAPLLLWALVRAIRDGRAWGFGAVAAVVGLMILTPHPPMTLYALMAAGIFTLYLVFFDPDRDRSRSQGTVLTFALGAVLLGAGIAAVQILPVYHYLPYSTRAIGHSASSYAYATSYALPPLELVGTILPQFNGIGDYYWGENFFKAHTEYLGAVVVAFALLGLVARRRDRAMLALAVIGGLFLMVSLGGHTPFYHLWYEVVPYIKKVRAPGMAFFLVALPVAVWAGAGVEELLARRIPPRRIAVVFGVLAAFGLLGAFGALQGVTLGLVNAQMPRSVAAVQANAPHLIAGGFRLLIVAALGGLVAWLILSGRIAGSLAAAALGVVLVGDLYSVDRQFVVFSPPTPELFAKDSITTFLAAQPKPFRVFDAPGESAYQIGPVYPGDFLMSQQVQTVFGYHGNEEFIYDQLWGGKNVYQYMVSPNLWALWNVDFALFGSELDVPGFHKVMGPVQTTPGSMGFLYQRNGKSSYAWVVPGAVKLPEDRLSPTVLDPKFPLGSVVLLPDSAPVTPVPLSGQLPAPSPVTARVTHWAPGAMTIAFDSTDTRPTWLVIAETFFPDWQAKVDGKPVPVLRGNAAQLALGVPAGAHEVTLVFDGRGYGAGKLVTALSVLLTLVLIVLPVARARRRPA